jgi:hypothetical protein
MGKNKNAHRALAFSLKGKGHLEYLCIDGRIILKRSGMD